MKHKTIFSTTRDHAPSIIRTSSQHPEVTINLNAHILIPTPASSHTHLAHQELISTRYQAQITQDSVTANPLPNYLPPSHTHNTLPRETQIHNTTHSHTYSNPQYFILSQFTLFCISILQEIRNSTPATPPRPSPPHYATQSDSAPPGAQLSQAKP
jgi:hypothetical protein